MSVITSPEFHINQKSFPEWVPGLHFEEQSKSSQDYWSEELDKIIDGITINGVFIHPWLYFHVNHWPMFIDELNNKGNIIRKPAKPVLRDNEWLIQECLLRAERDKKGLMFFGSRRFGKTGFISSYMGHGGIIEEGGFNSIIGGSAIDLGAIQEYLSYGLRNIPEFFRYSLVGQWNDPEGVALCRKYIDNSKDVWSRIKVTNVDNAELRSREKTAGPTPTRSVFDEIGKYPFKEIYLAAKPSFETPYGMRLVPILMGCVCDGTEVHDGNGELLNIEDIDSSMGIIGFNDESLSPSVEDITYIQEPLYKECVRITTDTGRVIEVSCDHPFLVEILASLD